MGARDDLYVRSCLVNSTGRIQSPAFAITVGRASSSQPCFAESADANGDEKGA